MSSIPAIMPTYGRLPVSFERGEGAYLFDSDGNRYLDALAGIAVCGLGHAHPAVTDAIQRQAGTLLHTSNLYEIPLQTQLATRLCEISGMDNVFFANSGAEANEAALKIARRYGNERGIENPQVIAMDGSFHGRTMATLTATGNRKVHAGFEPLLGGFIRAPYNDITAITNIAANNNGVVAIFVEPVLGEGGVQIPNDDYLPKLREICDDQNWLLILDEVQTGNGRTGRYFAYQHSNILPDTVTTAKGLGNGVPIGVCLARGTAAETLVAGTHGSTFGGNPLSCAAALAVITELTDGGVIQRAAELGERIKSGLANRLAGLNHVRDIRGKGMMIAVELNNPCTDLIQQALSKGLLLNVTTDTVLRLLPPLNLTDDEADEIVTIVSSLVQAAGS
ncbi:MAG: aspartate aminotransferase family protein [Pseudomonadota bacterium]|uniref:Acetylornithine transaminase n=1 Tax=marine metagenome TaxID=408172 RepID=A0A381PHA6_9ZZZZ|nr:aspartate aminotransferase family protein [Gammaproteobacteria bacterium]MEC9285602.1 aspartate aminotransferase family protein [Pseudomonadota bacterium]HBP15341.1 aspartate aminotransferase family protein [Gammaproteobacteria bacterium]HCP50560.1 aspartate aminotransferase family protein [Gammaproteobacteria bacterium]